MSKWGEQEVVSGLSNGIARPSIRLPPSPAMSSTEKFDSDFSVDFDEADTKGRRRTSASRLPQRGFPYARLLLLSAVVIGCLVFVERPVQQKIQCALPVQRHVSPIPGAVRQDYYSQPGMMVINHESDEAISRARYVHLSQIDKVVNQTSDFPLDEPRMRDGWDDLSLLRDAIDDASSMQDMAMPAQLDHLRNKTILLLGDSVDRFFVDRFCNEMMEDSGARLSYRALHVAPQDLSDISNKDNTAQGKDFNEFAEPHLCELPPQLGGMKIWSLMHYGVLPQDEYEWAFKQQARSPRVATKKVEQFAKLLKAHGYQAPDLVSVHSG